MRDAERHQMERAIVGSVLLDCSGRGESRCLAMAINEGVESDWFMDRTLALAWYAIRVLWGE